MSTSQIHIATGEDTFLWCDFDRSGRLAALIRQPSGNLRIEAHGKNFAIPKEWELHITRLKWASEHEIFVWPISSWSGKEVIIGLLNVKTAEIPDFGTFLYPPLDIFTDDDLIAWTYPEEHYKFDCDLSQQSDLISILSFKERKKISRFIEPFSKTQNFSNVAFLEVEHGVVDCARRCFWFTAYMTDSLWLYHVDSGQIITCSLACSRWDVLSICCDNSKASIILIANAKLVKQIYSVVGGLLSFIMEVELQETDEFYFEILQYMTSGIGKLFGYANNTVALTTSKKALLVRV